MTQLEVTQPTQNNIQKNDDFSNPEKLKFYKRVYCQKGSDLDFIHFIEICKTKGLSPVSREIYAVFRKDGGQDKMTVQVSIDGLRKLAVATGEYEGQTAPQFADNEGNWHEAWIFDYLPKACKIGIYRKGFREPLYQICLMREFNQGMNLWKKMPVHMLAKCTESCAIRKAFPDGCSGLYTTEEMNTNKKAMDRKAEERAATERKNEADAKESPLEKEETPF